ncbi:hypothetical protein SAMN04487970_101699 [Paenibacillus tianmuensis]|uniref:Prophage tail endopeptidase domain-containing protein n=1 Tax=Paenibacillus tianmuensis TaxID=624147 RepID=A0A1G4RLQ0_9BACL|nr:hypothetical protein [Paenibacillus tianmuensis]SCW57435.1 hypothetical protein SAMN04487970_101699 [Paenibacillus tianmuensis]
MSNATIIQTRDTIFIGSDSATSVLIDEILYRHDTIAKKLYHIDDMVIFCSGELDYCYRVIEKFLLQDIRNVESLKNLIVQSHNGQVIEVVVCEHNGEQTVLHQLSSYNNFLPTCYSDIPRGGVNLLTAGIRTKESYEIACKNLTEGKNVTDIYREVFDNISFEGVGGMLTVYRINRSGINTYLTHKIKEKSVINHLNPDVLLDYFQKHLHLVVGERIYGKVVSGVNLAIEDEHGIVKWQGSKGEIFNRAGKLVMKMGLVEEKPPNTRECFGLQAFNDITKVSLTDCKGIAVERKNNDATRFPSGWEKVLWAGIDGTLYTHDLVAEEIKIVNNVGKTILDAENNYLDLGDFEKIAMDNKFSTLEKLQVITELYKIEASYKRMLEQAEKYKTSQRDDVFDTSAQFFKKAPSMTNLYSTTPLTNAYNALVTYMEQFMKITSKSPLNIDVNDPLTEKTSDIADRSEFILKFKNYYDAEKDLRNKIEDSQFYSGLNMGQFYNNVVIGNHGFIALRNDGKYRAWLNATNGLALQKWENNRWTNKVYASIGNTTYEDGTLIAEDLVAKRLRIETKQGGVLLDAAALNFDFTVLDSIILDDVIVATEKITLANQYKSITKQYTTLKDQINRYTTTIYNDRDSSYYGLDDAKNQLVAAGNELVSSYNALTAYMNPVFANMNATTHIVNDLHSTRTAFHQMWENFYKAYEGARAKLADFLEKSSLQLGRNYNNTVIDAQNGVVVTRGNMLHRTIMNATEGISIEANIGSASSPNWIKKFYAGLDGKLYAEDLMAIRLRILSDKGDMLIDGNDRVLYLNKFDIRGANTITAEHIVTNTITADDGYIASLTVDHLKTLPKDANVGDYVDYIDIKKNEARWITGKVKSKDQAKDSKGNKLYWKDADKKYLTTEVTSHVAYNYDLDYSDKLKFAFKDSGIASYPYSVWGAGDGFIENTPDYRDSARGYLYKTSTEFIFRYNASGNGDLREVKLYDLGVDIISKKGEIKLNGSEVKVMSNNGSIQLSHALGTSIEISEAGDVIKLEHANGSKVKIDNNGLTVEVNGDINLNATGSIKLTGSRIDLN